MSTRGLLRCASRSRPRATLRHRPGSASRTSTNTPGSAGVVGRPVIRWLLSTVPSAMVWDDHDMHDDWNISADWVREMRREQWWHRRVEGGIMSYWLYQHLGNLTPAALRENELFQDVRGAGEA